MKFKTIAIPSTVLTVPEREMHTLQTANKVLAPIAQYIQEEAKNGWQLHSCVVIPATIVRKRSIFELLLRWIPLFGDLIWGAKPDYITPQYCSLIFQKEERGTVVKVVKNQVEASASIAQEAPIQKTVMKMPATEASAAETVAAEAVMTEASLSDDEKETEEELYCVRITDSGKRKLDLCKEIMSLTGWGLKEAKEAVDVTPSVIQENLPKVVALELQQRLEVYGATVEVTPQG